MINWAEMDNPWAFLAVVALVCAQLIITVIGQRRGKDRAVKREQVLTDVAGSVSDVAGQMTEVKEQVVNDHGDRNLRLQLDRIERNQNRMEKRQEDMAGDMRGVKKDVGRLADSAVDDRETHRTDIARVDNELKDLRRRMT
ncbi:hypothetical protein [Mycobacterium sp. HM-7]